MILLLALILFQRDGNDGGVQCFLALALFAGIFYAVHYFVNRHFDSVTAKGKAQREERLKELGATDSLYVGEYLVGLPHYDKAETGLTCVVTEDDFVFYTHASGPPVEVGRIPRNAVNAISVDTRGQVTQMLTLTRIVALGTLALAAPKRAKNYCLIIDWENENASRQNSVFEFPATQGEADSATRANRAANTLKKYVRPKTVRLRPDEKKCPYCAEVIKSEAVICRFCKSNL